MYKIQNNYCNRDADGNVVSHTIAIKQDEEYALIERTLAGDFSNKTDDELVEAVLEKFYQDTYLNRAEKESIEELKKLNAKVDETVNITKNSILELTSIVSEMAKHVGFKLGDDEDVEDDEKSKTTDEDTKGGDA